MKRFFFSLFFLFLGLMPVYSIDRLFNFTEAAQEEFIEYEKKRILCIFSFRKPENSNLEYLANGIPEVVFSSLSGFKFVYDEKPLEEVVVHSFGNPKKLPKKISRDPKFIPLEMKLIPDESIFSEDAFRKGSKLGCAYVLSGEFEELGVDSLKTNFELTNRKDGKLEKFSLNTSVRRAFQEIQSNSEEFKKRLLGKGSAGVKITTPEEGAFVYIDDEYAGKTPLEKLDLIPGNHKLLILQLGNKRKEITINLEKDKISSYNIKLEKELIEGKISVDSNPKGAEVFLGGNSIGFTPIENVSVPTGQNRLRLILENHVDHFQGVEIEKGKTSKFKINLKEGDTETYYKNRMRVFQDYTYYDFSLFSLYGSVIFYSSYMYAGLRSSTLQDKLQSFVKYTDFTMLQVAQTIADKSASGAGDLGTYQSILAMELFYQQSEVNKTMTHVKRYETIQNMSVVGAASMLIAAGLFYFWGIESDAIEFGWKPAIHPQESSESYMKLNFRF